MTRGECGVAGQLQIVLALGAILQGFIRGIHHELRIARIDIQICGEGDGFLQHQREARISAELTCCSVGDALHCLHRTAPAWLTRVHPVFEVNAVTGRVDLQRGIRRMFDQIATR